MATSTAVREHVEACESHIRQYLESNDLDGLRAWLAGQRAADIADALDRLSESDQIRVFRLLPPIQAADVLDEAGTQTTRVLLEQLPTETSAALLDQLPMDEVAEILTHDVPERQEELLGAMTPADAAEVRGLLRYPPHSAGRLMTEKFVRVRPAMSVEETLTYLRRLDPAEDETLTNLFIFDPEERVIGVVSLREVVTAAPERRLDGLMTTDVIGISPEADQEEVASLVARYDFLGLPVLTPDRHMLGVITVDDVIDVLIEEGTEDVLRFGGIEGGGVLDQPYFTVPLLRVVRKRVGWLLLLFVAETFTGSVLRIFQDELAKVVALAFFIPLLIGTGGNTGAQTVSTLIRGLALNEIRLRDTWKVIKREMISGVLLGLLLGVVAFGRALLWGSSSRLSLVVALTIVAICAWANTIGSLIPLVAQRFKIDPAVVSAPLITTLVDATGLAIYLLIAKVLLGL